MKTPIAYSRSWIGMFVSLTPLVALIVVNLWLWPAYPFAGGVTWLCFVLGARRLLVGQQGKGIRLVKRGQFAEAIPFFEQAYIDMCRRPWIDRFRWLLVGSGSRWSLREIALCNMAYCYGQTGDGQKMKEYYSKALAEFPDSTLASLALRMIDAASQKT